MIDQVWLLVGAVGSLVVGCSNSTQSTQAITAKIAQLGGPVGTIPGMMPMRLCTNNIFTGSNSAAVVHTSDDIVVGPLRSLRDAAPGSSASSVLVPDTSRCGLRNQGPVDRCNGCKQLDCPTGELAIAAG